MPKGSKKLHEEEEDEEIHDTDTRKSIKRKKPKGASTAYNLFVADHRAIIAQEEPNLSFGELSKRVSAAWKALSEDERKPYEERAEEDKKRYAREKAESPDDEDEGAPPKKKKKKDPNAPKKNLNAWMFFVQATRPEVVAELGPEQGKQVALVTKAIGERWAKMSPEDKQPFEDQAAADKKRYQQEMETYNNSK